MSKESLFKGVTRILATPYYPFLLQRNIPAWRILFHRAKIVFFWLIKLWKKIGLSERIFLLRRAISWLCTLLISPILILEFNYQVATISFFFITLFIALIFLVVTDILCNDTFQIEALKLGIPTKEGWIIETMRRFYKKGALKTFFLFAFLFFVEPLYFIILYRKGNHRYNFLPNKKTFLMFIASTLISTYTWSTLLYLLKPYLIKIFFALILAVIIWIIYEWKIKKWIKTKELN